VQSGYTFAVRRLAWIFTVLGTASVVAQPVPSADIDPTPQSIEEFQATAARVLQDAGVPGAGIALVRTDAVEWAGGVGYADRDARTPVTADTHFRVGSISKTFLAMALVQLSEDGIVDLDAAVPDIAPEVAIDNPWNDTAPVRIIHLLQHTAGFDDMHFNERYLAPGEAKRPLAAVLKLNSRRVRWEPETRMS
jgi:CubicO group peptidase (beta-lactamase class C family)